LKNAPGRCRPTCGRLSHRPTHRLSQRVCVESVQTSHRPAKSHIFWRKSTLLGNRRLAPALTLLAVIVNKPVYSFRCRPPSIGTHLSSSFDCTKIKHGKGTGVVYLVPLPDLKWKAYPLLTCLDSLTEFPEKVCAVIIARYFV